MVISGVGLQEERHAMSGQPGPISWCLPVALLWCKRASACNASLWDRSAGKERHESGGHTGPNALTLPVLPGLARRAGPAINPVQVFSTGLLLHCEFVRLEAGSELPCSCLTLPAYASIRHRSGLDFMMWSGFDHGALDLKEI